MIFMAAEKEANSNTKILFESLNRNELKVLNFLFKPERRYLNSFNYFSSSN